MYLEKRKTKKGIQYYLGHSFREGNKVHKIRKYLGKNLDEKTLKERKEKEDMKKAEDALKELTDKAIRGKK